MYGVEPIYRRIDSDTGAADDLYGDLTISLVILHQQDARAGIIDV